MGDIYATGRERAVAFTGDLEGISQIDLYVPGGMGAGPPTWRSNYFYFLVSWLGCRITASTDLPRTIAPTNQRDMQCSVTNGIDTDSDTDSNLFTTSPAGTYEWQVNLSGDYTISGTVQEYIEVEDTGEFPTYGGNAVDDPPHERRIRFFEKLKVGSTLTCTVNIGSMTASAVSAVTAGRSTEIGDYTAAMTVRAESWDRTAAFNIKNPFFWFDGNGNPAVTVTQSYADANHTWTIEGEGITAEALGLGYKTEVTMVQAPPRSYTLVTGCRAMEDAYPGSVNFRLDQDAAERAKLVSKADAAEETFTQQRYQGGGTFWTTSGYTPDTIGITPVRNYSAPVTPLTFGLDTFHNKFAPRAYTPLRIWVDEAWIADRGEQADDWRVLFRGRRWESFTLSQDATKTVTSTLASGTGATDLTINLPTGTTAAELQGSSFSGASMRGYRYLRLNMKASAGETVTVAIGGKQWNADKDGNALTLTTSYQDFDIDLCSPTNQTATEDDTDTFFPLPTADGEYWGVSNASSIVIGSISGGVTVDVASATLRRSSYSRATFLQPFPSELVSAGDGSTYPVRLVDGDTDGKRSLEGIHAYVSGGEMTSRTLSQLIDSIDTGASGAYPSDGWSATTAGSFPDDYHTNDRDACFAWGGGMHRSGSTVTYGFDKDASSALTVYAQAAWDSIEEWTPAIGDGLNAGDWGGPLSVHIAKIFRGQAAGLVLGDDSLPESGIVVSVGDGGADGTGTSGTDGSYQTGLTYPKGGTSADVSADAGPSPVPTVSVTFPARKRKRACFRVEPQPTTVGGALEVDSPRAWLHIAVEKRIRTYNSISGAIIQESDEHAVDVWKRLRTDPRRGRLFCYGVSGSTHSVYVSDDGGMSLTGVLSVTAETAALEVDSERGYVDFFFENGGQVYRHHSTNGGDSFASAEEVQYNSGGLINLEADDLLDTGHERRSGAYFLAAVLSGDTKVLRSYDAGLTWDIVLS